MAYVLEHWSDSVFGAVMLLLSSDLLFSRLRNKGHAELDYIGLFVISAPKLCFFGRIIDL